MQQRFARCVPVQSPDLPAPWALAPCHPGVGRSRSEGSQLKTLYL